MYSLKVEAQKRAVLGAMEDELDEGTAALRDALEVDLAEGAVEFSIGNPRVEHITGVVHLYRDFPVPPPQQVARAAGPPPSSTPGAPKPFMLPEGRGPTICCLAIPADMSMADFCNFCGAYLEAIRSMRVLRREARSQVVCMVLIRFGTQQQADDFYRHFNQKPFSSLEPEIVCRLVWVRAVELVSPNGQVTTTTPHGTHISPARPPPHQQQQQQQQQQMQAQAQAQVQQRSGSKGRGGSSSKGGRASTRDRPAAQVATGGVGRAGGGAGGAAIASADVSRASSSAISESDVTAAGVGGVQDGHGGVACGGGCTVGQPQGGLGAGTELPSCPVCLERLDEYISGIVTTVCNHQFHSECLQKWGDTSCPVCRYCSQPDTHASQCRVCGASADLWICLICGHVGCGRYRAGHAIDHWQSSSHCYALDLETQRVWDYVGDNYVHRLIQSKTDGKLVEVPSPGPARPQRRLKRRGSSKASGSQQQLEPRRGRRKGRSCGPGGRPSTSQQEPQACSSGGARRLHGSDDGRHHGSSGAGQKGLGSWSDSECGSSEYEEYEDDEQDAAEAEELKHAMMASKLDHIAAEYNHLLASQLDNQRAYFEGMVMDQAAKMEGRLAGMSKAAAAAEEAASAACSASKESERKRQALEKKLAESTAAAAKACEERDFLRTLNEQLLANQKQLRAATEDAKQQLAGRDATIQDLQEQVRDLMFFIEGQRAIAASGSGSELEQGTVLPLPASSPPQRRGRKGKK